MLVIGEVWLVGGSDVWVVDVCVVVVINCDLWVEVDVEYFCGDFFVWLMGWIIVLLLLRVCKEDVLLFVVWFLECEGVLMWFEFDVVEVLLFYCWLFNVCEFE